MNKKTMTAGRVRVSALSGIEKKLLFGAAAILLLLFMWLLRPAEVQAADEQTAPEGIYIENVNVAGMTESEIQAVIDQKFADYQQSQLTLYDNGTPVYVTAGELGLTWTNTSLAQQALSYGSRGNILHRYIKDRYLEENGRQILTLEMDVDRDTIASVIQDKCSPLDVAPVNPTFTKGEDGFEVTEGTDGQSINVDASTDILYNYMTTEWHGGTGSVNLQSDVVEYDNTGNYDLVTSVIGTGHTEFAAGPSNRNTNISTAVSRLNGTVLLPGEELSVINKMAPFTAEDGYAPAGSYSNGEVIDTLGGGICQVSTTLYQAVLEAELNVTERNAHSMAVNYVNASMDAAVEEGSKDLRFVNNTDAAIYIEGTVDVDAGTVDFTIYGHETRDANRVVSYESHVLGATAASTTFKLDNNVGWGLVEMAEGKQGMIAEAYKVVTVDGVEQSREVISSSEYNMSPNVVTIAMGGATDEQRSIIENAVSTGDRATVQAALATCGVTADLTDSSLAFTADGKAVKANDQTAFLFTGTGATEATAEGADVDLSDVSESSSSDSSEEDESSAEDQESDDTESEE